MIRRLNPTNISSIITEVVQGGFEIACQGLGISKDDWDYANNSAGFHALIAIIGDQLGLPRHDPAAEQAQRAMRRDVFPEESLAFADGFAPEVH